MTSDPRQPGRFRSVVFDMDGLMLNTEDVYLQACEQLAESRGRRMSSEVHHRMLGRRPLEAFGVMADALGLDEPVETLVEESRQIFDSLLDDLLQTMPGLFACLEHVEACRLPKAVATSSPRSYLEKLLNRFQLLPRFRETFTAEDVMHGKPHPEIYLRAAEALSVAPREMLVFEDSEVGTTAAAAAGAFVVSIPNRHTCHQDFSQASMVIDRLDHPRLLALLRPI